MRGKNLVWLPLVLMILGFLFVSPGSTQEITTISVEPSEILGIPGDTIDVDITVTDVVDLYTYAFELHYEPAVRILSAVKAIEGDFLGPITGEPEFSYDLNHLEGVVQVGDTLKGNVSGYSGSGVLATIRFVVMEAGECPLTLHNTGLISSSGEVIPHDIVDRMYLGPKCTLDSVAYFGGHVKFIGWPGMTATFDAEVTNVAQGRLPIDLMARVRWDLTRISDGRVSTMWSGQTYRTTPPPTEYLYVNEANEWYFEWDTVGTAPWLDAPDDGNYITSDTDAAWMFWFGFEDITLGTRIIGDVVLEGYTDGPYNEGIDYDAYAPNFSWLGSLYSSGEPAWVTPRWLDPGESVATIYEPATTEAGLNDFEMGLYFYDPGGAALGNDVVDCLRLRVEFSSVDPATPPDFVMGPDTTAWLDSASWVLAPEDVGFYEGTATLYFGTGYLYNEAEATFSVKLFVLPGRGPQQ